MSELELIKKDLDRYQKMLIDEIRRFPWQDRLAYGKWLANTYHYAFNSTRVIALGAGTMPAHLTSISNRFIQHAAEEKGHERLLENDIRALGFEITSLEVSTIMEAYYRSLYYWVSPAGNPVGLLGWILSLEALAANAGGSVLEIVKSCHPANSYSFLKVHSDADPEHLERALNALQSLNSSELKVVRESLRLYSENYIRLISELAFDAMLSAGDAA